MERIMLMQGNWSAGHLQSTCQVPDITSTWKLIQIPEWRALIQMQVPVSGLVGVHVNATCITFMYVNDVKLPFSLYVSKTDSAC